MHDLWIFPAPRSSRWFARMDWYLNWQMSKGLSYAGLHLPEETYRVADRHGLALDVEPVPHPTLLVLPGARVPTKKCLVVDDAELGLDEWFTVVSKRASQLKAGHARVFLPAGRGRDEARAAWTRLRAPFPADFEVDLETPQ